MFCNELEILQMRFSEYSDYVDYFVIVEARQTQTGKEKELVFLNNKEKFQKYLPKVIHVVIDKLPKYSVKSQKTIWKAENFQRNQILVGLKKKAKKGDMIIVSDVDEFWNREKLPLLMNESKPKVFIQKFFYYYVNCMSETLWTGTCCAPYGYFTPQEMRDYARFGKLSDEDLIKDGGWHYSYQGGIDRIKQKVINICESYRIIDKIGSTEDMVKKINNGEVLWNPNEKLHYIDFNKGKTEGTFTIKEFIRDNPSFYKEIEE